MRFHAPSIAAFVAFLAVSNTTQSYAGIYNMQSILATEADGGLSGAINASVDWRTGNVDYLQLSTTPLARFRSDKHLVIGLARINHRTSNGDIINSSFFEHLRYRYTISDLVLGEVFAQHEYDAIKRLQLRALVGVGPKFAIIDGDTFGLDVGVSYMLEYEQLQNDGSAFTVVTDLQHRNSTYLVARYKLDDRVQIIESAYIQPRLTDVEDIRIQTESELSFKITDKFSFSSSFTLAYDSRPPDTIKKLDTTLKSSFTFEF